MNDYSIALEEQLGWARRMSQAWSQRDNQGFNEAEIARRAVPFYWDGTLCPLLEFAAINLPEWTLHQGELPEPAGFIWFGTPIKYRQDVVPYDKEELNDTHYDAYRNAAHEGERWWMTSTGRTDEPDLPDEESWTGKQQTYCRWIAWGDAGETYLCEPGYRGATGGGITISYGLTLQDGTEPFWREFPFCWGYGETRNFAEMETRFGPYGGPRIDQILFAAIAFMSQRIVSTRSERASRAARHRLQLVPEPLIKVVRLRRHESRTGAKAEAVDWSYQWFVRGHWRQQWFPKRTIHQPLWILPYVKGPEDKPLKMPKPTVFAVVR